jgi:hypothetical protein
MSPELQEHIAGCPVCRDLVLVQEWMHRFKESAQKSDLSTKTLPTAEALWRRAEKRKRPDKKLVKKALWPLLIPQTLFYGLFLSGIILLTVWGFQKFGDLLDSRMASIIIPFFGITILIVIISLSFCALVVAFDRRKHPV